MGTLLEQAWSRCFADLEVSEPPRCALDELRQRYSEPHRAYHTLQHLEECFGWFAQMRPLAHAKGEVALALLYHDAIYDTHAQDNEQRSADLAISVLSEYTTADQAMHDRVESLILVTRHAALPQSQDEQLLVDIDLAILGATPERFDEYERQVRHEYAWVDDVAFRAGRSKILQQFLARKTIYTTPTFKAQLETTARNNLKRSLATLACLAPR